MRMWAKLLTVLVVGVVMLSACSAPDLPEEDSAECAVILRAMVRILSESYIDINVNDVPLRLNASHAQAKALTKGQEINVGWDKDFTIVTVSIAKGCDVK